MPNYDFMSSSAAVLHVQAPEDEENRLADEEVERLREKDRVKEREREREKEKDKVKEKEWEKEKEKENKKENNSPPPNSTSKEDFDTWKDCASNPKKQQKKLNDQKKTEKTEMFKSINQNVKKDSKEGPMAWFTRLPEMDEEMPSVSYLGGWIDRTRRYLSSSVVQLEKNEKEKRTKRRDDVLKEKNLSKKAEQDENDENVDECRNGNMKMETIDEGSTEKESQKEKEKEEDNANSPTGNVKNKAKRYLSNFKNTAKEQEEEEENINRNILRKFSVEGDNDRNSPKSIPELSLKTDSGNKFKDEKNENGEKEKTNGNLIRMNSSEELNNSNNNNNGKTNINNVNNGEDNGEKKEMRKLSSTKKRTVSFTLDSSGSELNIVGGENGKDVEKEVEGSNGNMNGNGNVNMNGNNKMLNALKDSAKNEILLSQTITSPPPPSSENSPLHSYQPRIRKNQLNSPPPNIPLSTFIQQNNKYSPDKTSRDFFALSPSPPTTLSHTTISTNSSASSSGLFPYFNKGISSSEESYESSVHREDIYKDMNIENDKKNYILDDIDKNINDVNIVNGHNNNNNNDKESWAGNDEDTNKKYTEVGGICDQLDYILSIHNFENMDVSGATFSPYRTQGNGKTWLEQIIKAADKPLRQTNTKKSRSAKRGLGTELNDLSDGQKSITNSTSSLNSSNHPSSSKLDIPSSTSTPAPTPTSTSTSIPLDDSSNTSIESNSQPLSLPLPAFTLPSSVYDYPLAPPLLPFINGMTETELHITQKLSLEIRKYNSTFLGRVSEPNAWKEYVKYNRATNDDEFYPNVRQIFILFYLFCLKCLIFFHYLYNF